MLNCNFNTRHLKNILLDGAVGCRLPQGAITDTSIGIKTRNAIAWNGRWWLSDIIYDQSQEIKCNKKWWPTRCSIVPSVGGNTKSVIFLLLHRNRIAVYLSNNTVAPNLITNTKTNKTNHPFALPIALIFSPLRKSDRVRKRWRWSVIGSGVASRVKKHYRIHYLNSR